MWWKHEAKVPPPSAAAAADVVGYPPPLDRAGVENCVGWRALARPPVASPAAAAAAEAAADEEEEPAQGTVGIVGNDGVVGSAGGVRVGLREAESTIFGPQAVFSNGRLEVELRWDGLAGMCGFMLLRLPVPPQAVTSTGE